MTRYEVAATLARPFHQLLTCDPAVARWPELPLLAPPFKDVPEAHWAADNVNELRERGILAGYSDATLRGDQVMTQGELAVILYPMKAHL